MTCRKLDTRALGLPGVVRELERSPADVDPEIHGQVEAILGAVRARGDAALLEFT